MFFDSTVFRVCRFYSVAVPAFLHYEWTDRTALPEDRLKKFEILHNKYSPEMEKSVLKMRGFFLKAAQLMSIREDYLPDQYLLWTRHMQNEAPISFTSEEAKEIVCNEFGLKNIEEKFANWTDIPIGSASIGQVYRATLLDGTDVAVKVQAPYAEKQFRSDLKACKFFCQFALPHLVVSLDEIERQFATEFDYQKEGANLSEIKRNLDPTWFSKISIPSVISSSSKVLIMEFIPGETIAKHFQTHLNQLAEQEGRSTDSIRAEMKLKLMEKGLASFFTKQFSPLAALVSLAMNVHGHQIFVDQTFNGDPHPGNLLITPTGKLGLIDFGQVKRLCKKRTAQIARLVIALNKNEKNTVCDLMKEMGSETQNNDCDTLFKLTAFWLDRDTNDITDGLDMHKFLQLMEKRDPQKQLCQDLVMVSRCSVMLRSLALGLGLRVRTTDYWRRYAEAFLEKFDGSCNCEICR